MREQANLIRIKRKTILYLAVILIALVGVTPVLEDYLGPNRTVTETGSVCKVVLYECQYVAAKDIWKYKSVDSWACSNESKPWRDYPSNSRTCNDNVHDAGYQYWEREDISQTVTNTYPPATINGSLQNCVLQNGWCASAPQLSLSATEPVPGYNIIAIEGSLNGQNFVCASSNCSVPLGEGDNNFTYWALSSWGDSSTMGTFTAKVDSQLPNITGAFTGTLGSNGWYLSPVSFNGNAFDITSGLASFTCSLDGGALGSCSSIVVNNEGLHTLVLTARDNAGNARTLTQNTSVDTQNPVLSAALNGTLGSNSWYTSAKLNASASDTMPGSGLSSFEYNLDNGGWIVFPTSGVLNLPDGKHSADTRAMDNAGRTTLASKPFWLDSVAPAITLNLIGTPGANNWYITNLNVTASASDDTSGLDVFDYTLDNNSWSTYSAPLTLVDGSHNLSFWAQDSAGLVTQVDRIYKVDTQAPQITGSLSGILGANGWYTSEVTLSASASDPTPGSGLDVFTYTLDNNAETSYTNDLVLSDGQHNIELSAQDNAGLTYSMQQSIKVDTKHPSLNIQTTLPNWIKESVTLSGTSGDSGSGLSRVEISTDGGQTWQPVTGLTSWNYTWDTTNSSNGTHEMSVRAIDNAGLTTKQTLAVGVDNRGPKITLPDSWYQWDTVTVDVWDNLSGLSRAYIEISDPEDRWPKRVISLDPKNFPLEFKWDRRFGDDTIAPLGTYDLKVIAFDHLDNIARKGASVKILLSILPAGPTSTPQPYSRDESAETSFSYTATPIFSPPVTQSAVVSTFGIAPQQVAQATPTSEEIPVPHATPSQTTVIDWLESIFKPNPGEENVSKIGSLEEAQDTSHSAAGSNDSVLWGTAAAAMIGAVTAYAAEERRKQEEEKARQAALEAEEEERREKKQARKMEKMEEKRAQEQAWEQARQEARQEELEHAYHIQNDIKIARLEVEEETRRIASQIEAKKEAEEKKKAEELKEGLAAYYNATRQGEKETSSTQTNWWENTKSFVSENIIQPVNTYVYEPFIKPALQKSVDIVTNGASWIDDHVYQPYVTPALDRTKEFVSNESTWIKEHVYQPYVKPAMERTKEFVSNETAWINENIYQPYIKPAVKRSVEFVTTESAWINENIYQPYVKPVVERTKEFINNESEWINENIYQPYLKPVVATTTEWNANYVSWVNKNIYQPIFEPVVSDINQYIYQPLVDKATNWWDKYGEWVHNSMDAVGFVPGLGDIADGLNGLIYLGEGRYIEAGISALAMIPILGDLGKAGKWGLQLGEEVLEEATEQVVKEATEELVEKAVKESLEVAEKTLETTVVEEAIKETLEYVDEQTTQHVLKEVVEGKVTKLPTDIAEKLTDESANELAGKISKELGGKRVLVSAKTGSIYVSSSPVEGLLLAEQLAKTDLTKTDEVEKIFKRVAELTSRGSGNHVVLGPFGTSGTFIQEALDTNGIFWDVGDELWKALDETGVDMFKANDQFLQLHIGNGIDRFDVIRTDVHEVIEYLNDSPPIAWKDIRYTEKEILDLASMPDIPYQLVDNSWVRVDLINSME
jgi:hypothetical protein